jgi:RNA polymerase nonessential primary-like sigma factor
MRVMKRRTAKLSTDDHIGATLKKYPLLTPQQERELMHQVKAPQDTEIAILHANKARQKIIASNLRLVAYVAHKVINNYRDKSLNISDLIHEGVIGLNRAIDKFQPEKGFKFSTYAYYWIKQAITRSIENKAETIRIPVHVGKLYRKIKKIRRENYQLYGTHTTNLKIAEQLGTSEEKIDKILADKPKIESLNQYINDDDDREIINLIPNSSNTAEEYIMRTELREIMEDLLNKLPPLQQQILKLLFGWDKEAMNYRKIAKELNLKYHKVRGLAASGLKELKRYAETAKDYL